VSHVSAFTNCKTRKKPLYSRLQTQETEQASELMEPAVTINGFCDWQRTQKGLDI
jgi:hypothetical protein